MKKQIEEIAKDVASTPIGTVKPDLTLTEMGEVYKGEFILKIARHLYSEGYRKQSEGEWYEGICTNCGHEALDYLDETPCGCSMRTYITKYCPNCGAKMKGK